MRVRVYSLLLAGLVAACSARPAGDAIARASGSPLAKLHQLRGDEIEALIVGRTLLHDVKRRIDGNAIIILSNYKEIYRHNGKVDVLIHRAGMSGQYTIDDNRLCIFLDKRPPECRYIFRLADGTLVQKDALVIDAGMVPIIIE